MAARHHPEGLEQLLARTQFTKRELQSLYRGFKNVSRGGARLGGSQQRQGGCLTGVPLLSPPRSVPVGWWTRRPSSSSTHSSSPRVVSLGGDTHGTPHSWGTAGRCGMVAVVASPSMCPPPDASSYAHFLFDAFDADHSGTLCFQVSGHQGATQAPPPVGGWVLGTAAQPGVEGAGGGNRIKIATSQNRTRINRNNRPRSMGRRTEGTGRGTGTPRGCHWGPGVTQGVTVVVMPAGFRRWPLAAAAGDGAPEAGVGLQPLRPQQGWPHQQGGDGGTGQMGVGGRGTGVP